jgi:hypothetical protein
VIAKLEPRIANTQSIMANPALNNRNTCHQEDSNHRQIRTYQSCQHPTSAPPSLYLPPSAYKCGSPASLPNYTAEL